MAGLRFNGVQKATALVPLALLSTAWTANLVGVGTVSPVAATSEGPSASSLPDGTSVPTQALEAPASVTQDGVIAPGLGGDPDITTAADSSSPNGIPAAALAAYQRAEAIINSADRACNLDWELLAAIGRVESDHGRYGGNVLNEQGVATPGIYGIALNGKNDTVAISDTDAGQYDGDTKWDRAVGPMQFIPSTWSVVGVDADGDGKRNPQDIDDAALASAVYLCSGDDDLSTVAGRRAAVYRYNHSEQYVDLVLTIMNAYMTGDFSAVPNNTTSASTFTPSTFGPTRGQEVRQGDKGRKGGDATQRGDQQQTGGNDDTRAPGSQPGDDPTTDPSPSPEPSPSPTDGPILGGGSDQPLRDGVKSTQDTLGDVTSDVTGGLNDTLDKAGDTVDKVLPGTGDALDETGDAVEKTVDGVTCNLLGICSDK